MNRNGFGQILRSSREYQGISINAAASRLRIRPDILRSIEEGDFSRMPQRGYARNMINAYARFLGLNPTELTTMYLDELHSYQASLRGSGFDSVAGSQRGQRSGRTRRGQNSGSHDPYGKRRQPPYSETTGRAIYSDRTDRNPLYDREDYSNRTRSSSAPARDRARQGGMGAMAGRGGMDLGNRRFADAAPMGRGGQSNLFSTSKSSAIVSKLPIIVIAILVVVLLGFIISSVASCATNKQETNVSNVPITGIADTTNTNDGSNEADTPAPTPPTAATFTYTVGKDKEAYVEIYENNDEVPSLASIEQSGATKTYQVTSKLKFVTTAPGNVKVSVDGTEVKLNEEEGGLYSYTVDFPQILAQWNAANGYKTSSSTTNKGNTSNSSNTSNTNSSSSGTTNTNKNATSN